MIRLTLTRLGSSTELERVKRSRENMTVFLPDRYNIPTSESLIGKECNGRLVNKDIISRRRNVWIEGGLQI